MLEANGFPYGMSPGNHDQYPSGVANFYDQFFPPSRFLGLPWYGGYLGAEAGETNRLNKDNYELFSVGGLDFLVIHIETDWPSYAVTWADKIIKRYPNRRVILSTHAFLNTSNARPTATQFGRSDGSMSAEAVWQQLIKPNCNVFMVINGHYPGEGRRTDLNNCGQPVHQLLSDYQSRANGGDGWMRLYRFKPVREQDLRLHVLSDAQRRRGRVRDRRRQPVRARLRDAGDAVHGHRHEHRRQLRLEHARPRGAASCRAASTEWYATVNDGTVTTTGPIWSFTAVERVEHAAGRGQQRLHGRRGRRRSTVGGTGVLGNDTDADDNSLTAILVQGPTHGTLALSADGSFIYTPAANYNGPDSFTYKANDGIADSNVATVSITVTPVNDAPAAANDSYTVDEDTPLTVSGLGVLANDNDPDGNTLTAALVLGPTHGVLSLNANGTFTYTPAANYSGPDAFSYKANDGTVDSMPAVVAITVSDTNDGPVAVGDAVDHAGGHGRRHPGAGERHRRGWRHAVGDRRRHAGARQRGQSTRTRRSPTRRRRTTTGPTASPTRSATATPAAPRRRSTSR